LAKKLCVRGFSPKKVDLDNANIGQDEDLDESVGISLTSLASPRRSSTDEPNMSGLICDRKAGVAQGQYYQLVDIESDDQTLSGSIAYDDTAHSVQADEEMEPELVEQPLLPNLSRDTRPDNVRFTFQLFVCSG
jgi:hypothetical protein